MINEHFVSLSVEPEDRVVEPTHTPSQNSRAFCAISFPGLESDWPESRKCLPLIAPVLVGTGV